MAEYETWKHLVGRRVKLKKSARRQLNKRWGSKNHWTEFGHQHGTVLPPIVMPEGCPWPEMDVMWDSGFRYLYRREQLDVLP